MPGGGSLLGLGYFAGIKLAGYSLAGLYLNRRLETLKPQPVLFGLARTAIGVAVGAGFVASADALDLRRGEIVWLALLIPVRIGEWWLALRLFYQRAGPEVAWRPLIARGVLWSFALDLPALLAAFTLPGGIWIC